jgi:two-component system response regulator DctR
MSRKSAVFVVDDDAALREAIAFLLASRGLAAVMFASAEEFLAAYRADLRGCILTDVRMGGMTGLELFERLKGMGNTLPCLVLTGHGDVPMAVEALKKGAYDFIEKPFDGNALVDRLVSAIAADATSAEARDRHQTLTERLATLSEREREVMELMLAGKMNKVIAAELGIAMRTVEVHRAKIFEKLGVRNAVELSTLLAEHRRA